MAIQGIGSGIGSGMDINGIVKALVDAESAPKTAQLNRLEKATTAKFSGLSQFKNALSEFQTVLKELNNPSLFEKRSASSGKADVFTVKADASAVSGNYNVQVFNLAQTSKVALRGVENPSAQIGTGTLTVSAGDKTINVDVTAENNSLTGIRDAINASGKSAGISATIVNDPGAEGGARLVLSSSSFGTGNDLSVTSESTSGDLSVLNFTAPETSDFAAQPIDPDNPLEPRVISYARDANVAIDGIPISSASNEISEAIEGVTITLQKAQTADELEGASTINLNVGEDKAGVTSAVNKFVDAYNKLIGTVDSLTSVTSVGGENGEPLAAALVGDSSVRSFMASMRSELGSASSSGGPFRILADLGVTTQRDGTLAVDDARLSTALNDNFDKLGGFLTGADGLMGRLEGKVKPYAETGGILESRTSALQNTLNGPGGVDEQREQLNRRLEQLEARLFSQFNAMDSLVGQLTSTSNFLTSALDSLPGSVRQDKN
ncbi:flagellar filament capping protein FliD [Halopseudomonas pelagia]|uniref:flagellar filament capping protein FliD n=1 Tax=Halopseudomonas pelagia TaxID=553151 RepID=UPI0030DA96DD